MSIATEIAALAANKAAIKSAIEAKNPATAPTDALAQWPTAIASIPTGGGGGWQPPSDWPDIRQILADDVTPQEAIDAGATKKWIMLCNPGPPGGIYPNNYTFDSALIKYLRISDGNTTVDQSSNIVEPLDSGRFWIIVYTTDMQLCRLPLPRSNGEVGVLWVYAPDHTGYRAISNDWTGQVRLRSITVKDWGLSTSGFSLSNNVVLENLETTTTQAPMTITGFVTINECALKKIDCSGWDVSNVTNITNLFSNDVMLSEVDVAGWDVSNVTLMNYAFNNCKSLTHVDITGWDVGKVINMQSMFNGSAIQELDLSMWNTESVTNMQNLFGGCFRLRKLNLTGWNTKNVTNLTSMFTGCRLLERISGISQLDVSGVVTMADTFSSCTAIDILDLSAWNTSSLTSMQGFMNSAGIRYVDMSNWDASNVTNINYAFNSHSLIEIKLPTDPAKGPRIDVSFSGSPGLSHNSLVNIIAWVADLNSLGLPGKTLTLGNTNKAKLTADEIAVATAKGWTVA